VEEKESTQRSRVVTDKEFDNMSVAELRTFALNMVNDKRALEAKARTLSSSMEELKEQRYEALEESRNLRNMLNRAEEANSSLRERLISASLSLGTYRGALLITIVALALAFTVAASRL
jgi:uncharacterized coiled-coil DUF342 family protein